MVDLVIPVTENINEVNSENFSALGYSLKQENF